MQDKSVAEMKRLLATARKEVRGSIHEEIRCQDRWWAMTRWDGHADRVSEAEADLMGAWGKGEGGSDSGELISRSVTLRWITLTAVLRLLAMHGACTRFRKPGKCHNL